MARFLALDWDQNFLHIISADLRGKRVEISKAAVWSENRIPNPAETDELGQILKDRLKEAGIKPAPVLACIGRDRLIVKDIRFPAVPDAEEPALVRFQAIKELTDSPEDVIIDYVVNGKASTGEQKAAALVIRKEVLETYRKICEAAGLKLQALTPRLIGVTTCLRKVMGSTVVTPLPEPPEGVICIGVIGEKFAEISIVRGESCLLARSVSVNANIAGEIRKNLAVHGGQQPHSPVVAVYLAGKGSGELRERVSELVDVPVHTFDPFAGAETTQLPTGNRGSFAGAMGLLHIKSTGELPINFVSPRQPKPPSDRGARLARLAMVAGIALVLGLVVLGRVLHASWSDDLLKMRQEITDVERKLKMAQENGKKIKAIDDWDTMVVVDELYDLTYRIPDVNKLRVTSITVDPLPRNPKTRAAARFTVKGNLLSRTNPEAPLDQLRTQFRNEGYTAELQKSVDKNQFTLVITAERRAPEAYKHIVEDPDIKAKKAFSKNKSEKSSEDDKKSETKKSKAKK